MKALARQVIGTGTISGVVARQQADPRPGELLLRIHATSLNYHDLVGIDGGIPGTPVPRVPCSDASATVLAVGSDSSAFAVGDAVVPNFFPNWLAGPINAAAMDPVFGDAVNGMLQTHICVPQTAVARAPAGLSHEEIATLGCAGLTAWRSLIVEARIRPGQTVCLQGTGGVSLAALSFAKMAGARVIITSSSDEKLDRARALGADEGINYRRTPDWHEEVVRLTGGLGADVVVEVGGGETLGRSLMAARVGGHVSVIGVLSGFLSENFPMALVMQRNLALKGITVGSRDDLDSMCRAIEQNGYRPVIDTVYELEDAHEAIAALRRQIHFGKIVVRMPAMQ